MRVYNSIPSNIKPLVGAANIDYDVSFESNFALLLRERKTTNLSTMLKYALEVEANFMATGILKQTVEVDMRKVKDEN